MPRRLTPETPPKRRYIWQRNGCRRYGIPFTLTFEEWNETWLASGHWPERGKEPEQYCLARKDMEGIFEAGNVEIIRNRDLYARRGEWYAERLRGRRRSPETCAAMSEGMKESWIRRRLREA